MEALGDARAANGEATFLAIALLHEHARDVPQRIGKALGEAVGVALGRDDGHGAGGAAEAVARLGHDGGVFGVATAGDDDAVDDGRGAVSLGSMGEGRRQAGADEQRARRRGGLERHGRSNPENRGAVAGVVIGRARGAEVLVFRRGEGRWTAGAAARGPAAEG
ncbi:hypothetical protein D3C81_1667150 [compost metagenome]